MNRDSTVMLLYVPVLHQGYVEFFERHRSVASELWLPGPELLEELMPLHQEIRALNPYQMAAFLQGSGLVSSTRVFRKEHLEELTNRHIITAREDISRELIKLIPGGQATKYDNVFLRWDESSVAKTKATGYDRITTDQFDRRMMRRANRQAERSGDWWRHVGGVLVKDGVPITQANNRHVPSQHTPYINGDPRDFIEAGTKSEVSTALHCEQGLITWAARNGMALEEAWLYVTTFPCPMCAKLVAYSGITKVFFESGHASLDGKTILQQNNVELVLVQ